MTNSNKKSGGLGPDPLEAVEHRIRVALLAGGKEALQDLVNALSEDSAPRLLHRIASIATQIRTAMGEGKAKRARGYATIGYNPNDDDSLVDTDDYMVSPGVKMGTETFGAVVVEQIVAIARTMQSEKELTALVGAIAAAKAAGLPDIATLLETRLRKLLPSESTPPKPQNPRPEPKAVP